MITMKDVVREGHPALRQVAKSVDCPVKSDDALLLNSMLQFLKDSQDEALCAKYDLRPGVGVAAPQLGICKRMFAVHFEDESGKIYSDGYINPKIVSHSVQQTYLPNGEGCLSVDRDVAGIVPRFKRLTVKATNLAGECVTLKLKDFAAIVFQHELDHLNGIMFYDHINAKDPLTPPVGATPCD